MGSVLEEPDFEGGDSQAVSSYMSEQMIKDSVELCKSDKTTNPVKLTWENLKYEVEIKVNAKDAKNG